MKVFFLNPEGKKSTGLFDSFVDNFLQAGHTITDDLSQATVVFMDGYSGLGRYEYETLEWVEILKTPIVYFDAWDYQSRSNPATLGWEGLKYFRQNMTREFPEVYFMRKMQKDLHFPSNVYPLELCIYPDHDFEPATKEELFSRHYDMTFVGNASIYRANVICDLLKYRTFNIRYIFPYDRLPHDDWLNEHRKAKMFIEADGGGFGSERPYQLISIAPMIRQRNPQLFANPWTDMVNCLEVGDYLGRLSDKDIEKLLSVLNDKNKLHEIYLNGMFHVKTYFTQEYRANYVLDVLSKNDIK